MESGLLSPSLNNLSLIPPQEEKVSVPIQDKPHTVTTLEPGVLEKMVNLLVPLHQKQNPFFVPAFLCTYRRLTRTGQVLDLLFNRYAHFQPNCEEDEQVKNTLCSMIAMWLDQYPEDFCQSKDLTNLNKLMAYALLHMPSSYLAVRGHLLLTQLQDQETKETVTKTEDSLDLGPHTTLAPEIRAEDVSVMAADAVLESVASPAAEEDLVPPHLLEVQYVSSV
ncbi:ral guanine nucleotide dissociation stimulator-like [Thomomys bottae]